MSNGLLGQSDMQDYPLDYAGRGRHCGREITLGVDAAPYVAEGITYVGVGWQAF